jgi:GDSL-like Lipase/Acylhydrolase family
MLDRSGKLVVITAFVLVTIVIGAGTWTWLTWATATVAARSESPRPEVESSAASLAQRDTQAASTPLADRLPTPPGAAIHAEPEASAQVLPAFAATDPSVSSAADQSKTTLADGSSGASVRPASAVRILQLGDSHTAADYFTGELRRRLQARFGRGGIGYLVAGHPRSGFRSDLVKVTTSGGWTYQAIQKSEDVSQFWLSGFNAISANVGDTITYTAEAPISFDSIELNVDRRPQAGTLEVRLDGVLAGSFDLNGITFEPVVFRLRPQHGEVGSFRQLQIRAAGSGPVVLSSVGIYDSRAGLSFSSVGYPGATISLLNKFNPALFADDLRRLDPQIVIVAFGTNEAANESLTADSYWSSYERAITRIKDALPRASIVVIGPPDGEERDGSCKKAGSKPACHLSAPPPDSEEEAEERAHSNKQDCNWRQLVKLGAVRDVQRSIAARSGFPYWDWASIMPPQCGAHQWVSANPPLMTPDHIHFTHDGYAKSAEQFLSTIVPLVERHVAKGNAVSAK